MTIYVAEKPLARSATRGTRGSGKREYRVLNAQTEAEAFASLQGVVSPILDGLVLDTLDVNEVAVGIWEATARYVTPEKKDQKEEQNQSKEPGDFVVTFDTTGGTTNKKVAISTTSFGTDPPDVKNAIGVTKDGVEGVDIIIPAYAWTEAHIFSTANVNSAFTRKLRDLTGSVNAGTFRGFPPHEVLFQGATGQKQGNKWTITYKFASSKSDTFDAGDITEIEKRGWDYVWYRFSEIVDSVAKALVRRPVAAYVQQVYPAGNFADLGIGTEELIL